MIGQWIFQQFARLQIFLYRRSGGKAMGFVRGMPVLLLTSIGRKTGQSPSSQSIALHEKHRRSVHFVSGLLHETLEHLGEPACFIEIANRIPEARRASNLRLMTVGVRALDRLGGFLFAQCLRGREPRSQRFPGLSHRAFADLIGVGLRARNLAPHLVADVFDLGSRGVCFVSSLLCLRLRLMNFSVRPFRFALRLFEFVARGFDLGVRVFDLGMRRFDVRARPFDFFLRGSAGCVELLLRLRAQLFERFPQLPDLPFRGALQSLGMLVSGGAKLRDLRFCLRANIGEEHFCLRTDLGRGRLRGGSDRELPLFHRGADNLLGKCV